jgi:hypothetical protein
LNTGVLADNDGMAQWADWVRATYVIDATGEELLRLILEADARYRQARAVLDVEGLTVNGRTHPAVAIERDTRAAIQRLVLQLDLEEATNVETATRGEVRRFPVGA